MIKREDIGKRDEQQDSHFGASRNGVYLAVVADGLGGMQGGAIASNCIAEIASIMFAENSITHKSAKKFLIELKERAHDAIREKSIELGIDARSTITALITIEDKAYLLHSGDSRIYHFNKNKLKRRTKDHSLVQILVDRGKVNEEDMGNHPDQGKLYNCLGGESGNEADYSVVNIKKGDWFLLCTDGFWEHLSLGELSSLYPKNEDRANTLLLQAVRNGGDNCDNVTFITLYPKLSASLSLFLCVKRNALKLLALALSLFIAVLLFIFISNLEPENNKPNEQKQSVSTHKELAPKKISKKENKADIVKDILKALEGRKAIQDGKAPEDKEVNDDKATPEKAENQD